MGTNNKKLKIVFIGNFDRLYDEEGKARSFEILGCDVVRITESSFSKNDLNNIKLLKPDIILSAKFLIREDLLKDLFSFAKKEAIKTVAWHPDLYHFPSPVANQLRLAMITNRQGLWAADYVFSPDGCSDSNKLYKRCEINHHLIRQAPYHDTVGIYCKSDISDLTTKSVIPILFVGSMYNISDPFRIHMIKFLQQHYGEDFLWLGQTEHQVREERLSTLISKTKIVLGDSVYYPGYWSNRIYESIGRGGFVIHPYVPGIEEDFKENEECVFYNRWDFSDLKNKIDYYLKHKDERSIISKKGLERVKKDHTLLNRCKQILEILNEKAG